MDQSVIVIFDGLEGTKGVLGDRVFPTFLCTVQWDVFKHACVGPLSIEGGCGDSSVCVRGCERLLSSSDGVL